MAGWAARLLNAEGNLILELDSAAQAIIDVNIGRCIRAFRRIAVAREDRIYLPILVSRSVRIIRSKWWPPLRLSQW
jgi:hypothetical protein